MIALSTQEALAHSMVSAPAYFISTFIYLHHFDLNT
jgi:hypothetical protein